MSDAVVFRILYVRTVAFCRSYIVPYSTTTWFWRRSALRSLGDVVIVFFVSTSPCSAEVSHSSSFLANIFPFVSQQVTDLDHGHNTH